MAKLQLAAIVDSDLVGSDLGDSDFHIARHDPSPVPHECHSPPKEERDVQGTLQDGRDAPPQASDGAFPLHTQSGLGTRSEHRFEKLEALARDSP